MESLPPLAEQHGPPQLGGHLAKDEHRLGFKGVEMAELVAAKLASVGCGHWGTPGAV
jgi:hypothetical protein